MELDWTQDPGWQTERHNTMDPLRKLGSLAPAKQAYSLFDEFKQFAFKGNVIDLAVGVIIGAAFGKIIDSLVTSGSR